MQLINYWVYDMFWWQVKNQTFGIYIYLVFVTSQISLLQSQLNVKQNIVTRMPKRKFAKKDFSCFWLSINVFSNLFRKILLGIFHCSFEGRENCKQVYTCLCNTLNVGQCSCCYVVWLFLRKLVMPVPIGWRLLCND